MSIEVIPNGVDLEYFRAEAAPGVERATQPTILFCGAMDYTPNIDALRWYFSEMHEAVRRLVPQTEVIIVGKDPTPEVRGYAGWPNVTVTGSVPDVRPFYRRAWLQIVPLRIGGGTRLKIVESLAMRTPVISTTIGAQGLGLRHEHDILLADAANGFVQQTVRALKDAALRSHLETTGIDTVRRTLSWPMLGARFSRVLESAATLRAEVVASSFSNPNGSSLARNGLDRPRRQSSSVKLPKLLPQPTSSRERNDRA
jgi:glycosyltransferase involved in cell wall biosynthesis